MSRGNYKVKDSRLETELEYNLRRNREQAIKRAKARSAKDSEELIDDLSRERCEDVSEAISKYHTVKMDQY